MSAVEEPAQAAARAAAWHGHVVVSETSSSSVIVLCDCGESAVVLDDGSFDGVLVSEDCPHASYREVPDGR